MRRGRQSCAAAAAGSASCRVQGEGRGALQAGTAAVRTGAAHHRLILPSAQLKASALQEHAVLDSEPRASGSIEPSQEITLPGPQRL